MALLPVYPRPLMDEATFARLVAAKLSGAPLEETLFFGQYLGRPRPLMPFEVFVIKASAAIDRQIRRRFEAIETPPPPDALTLKSWQHGFTSAQDRSEAERALRGREVPDAGTGLASLPSVGTPSERVSVGTTQSPEPPEPPVRPLPPVLVVSPEGASSLGEQPREAGREREESKGSKAHI